MTGSSPTICGLVNLTVRCNQDCLFCCDGRIKGAGTHLTADEAKARITQVRSQGADSVTFIGGEPLVRSDLPDLVAFARSLGLRVGITTNGTLLTAPLLAALLRAGLTSIEVSVHSFDPESSDRISRRKNTAARQKAALELLENPPDGLSRPGVSLNFVIFSGNCSEIPEFVRHVARHLAFVDELFFNFVDPIGYPEDDPGLVPRYGQVAVPLREALDIARTAGLSYTVDSVPGCILGPHFLFLRATREKLRGVLYAKQTWNIENPEPDPDLSQYYRVNACLECPVSGLCPGVNFRYLKLFGQGEFRPFPSELLVAGTVHVPPELQQPPQGDLLQRLADSARRTPRRKLRLPLTDRCNQNCGWCPCRKEAGRSVSPARLAGKLEAAVARAGREDVLLSGGEPALHPRFFAIVKLLSSRSVRVGFTTNGRVFSLSDWARKALQAGARFAIWRVPAPVSSLATYTGDPQAAEQSLAGLDNLLAQRSLALEAEIAVPEGEEDRVEDTLRLLADRGIYRVRLIPQHPLPSERSRQWSHLASLLDLRLAIAE